MATGETRYELWKNTNRLLDTEGYLGMKTGTTTPAGACLVSLGERTAGGSSSSCLGRPQAMPAIPTAAISTAGLVDTAWLVHIRK